MSILRVWTRQCCRQTISRRYELMSSRFCNSQTPIVGALKFSEEVREAKAAGKPLVALESTIITHGMPYPHNLETARKVEDIIRARGAVPATIAILKGELTIGLSDEQLAYLSQAKGVVKSSRRDLVPIIAAGLDGATTVAGTIIAAELANIPIFVTGGIGGVHREGETTLDISADLTELGRSKTFVVCSGVKSILDIGRTLEFLETQGVCVCAFGKSKEFPAFYTPRSGFSAPHNVADAKSAAALLMASRDLGLSSGIVVAVPVPEHEAMDEAVIKAAIEKALKEANVKGIKGKEVTPYILAAVADATSGCSLATNIALIKNNASVGAKIAVEFNRLLHDKKFKVAPITYKIGASKISEKPFSRELHTSCKTYAEFNDFPMFRGVDVRQPVLVIGGSNVDRTYTLLEDTVQLDGSTHPSVSDACAGGVGRNMAEALWRLRGAGGVRLLTAVGDDTDGQLLSQVAPGLLLEGCVIQNGRTASYASVMDCKGECLLGLGDMDLHKHISIELVDKHLDVLKKAPLVVLDGNPPQETVDFVLDQCQRYNKHVFFEPTDKRKAAKALQKGHRLAFTSPNIKELSAMVESTTQGNCLLEASTLEEAMNLSTEVLKSVGYLILTMGTRGVIVATQNVRNEVEIRHYPIKIIRDVVNVSGAGDCFSSGFIHAMLLGLTEAQCISVALKTAKAALSTKNTVPREFTLDLKNKAFFTKI